MCCGLSGQAAAFLLTLPNAQFEHLCDSFRQFQDHTALAVEVV